MAEVIGPFGFSFGVLGFVFSTASTLVKNKDAYDNYELGILSYQLRYNECEEKLRRWDTTWRNFDNGTHRCLVETIRPELDNLSLQIETALDKRASKLSVQGLRLWKSIRTAYREKQLRFRLKHSAADVALKIQYMLYKGEKLERWMVSLEKIVKGLEELSLVELQRRTADVSSTAADVKIVGEVERFMKNMNMIATTLYDECTNIPQSSDWALGLLPPEDERTVKSWRKITHLDLRILWHAIQDTVRVEERVRISCSITQRNNMTLEKLLEKHCEDRKSQNLENRTSIRRTRPMSVIFQEGLLSDVVEQKSWKEDRARLVNGILHWGLLFWNTRWVADLCCCGLQFEKPVSQESMQIFTSGKHSQVCCRYWDSQLRNLGLVLAQLALGTNVRYVTYEGNLMFETWHDGNWVLMHRKEVLNEVRTRSGSERFREAVEFCFEDSSLLATSNFQPGFLLRCIEKIYSPVHEWCKVELSCQSWYDLFHQAVRDTFAGRRWPENALQDQDYPSPWIQRLPMPGGFPEDE